MSPLACYQSVNTGVLFHSFPANTHHGTIIMFLMVRVRYRVRAVGATYCSWQYNLLHEQRLCTT